MKKTIKIVLNVLAWILLIFALLITLMVFTADKNNGVSKLLGYVPLTVESDSMKPTFKKNDLIISHEINDVNDLKEGDVITFWTLIEGKRVKNTHRIVEVQKNGSSISFVTRGDNNGQNDDIQVYPTDIIGKWTKVKLSGFGKVMNFLKTKKGFFICILLPMALFFLFELYRLIAAIMEVKHPALTAEDEEEIKRKAVEEYLKEHKELASASAAETAAPPTDSEAVTEASETAEEIIEPSAESTAEIAAKAAEADTPSQTEETPINNDEKGSE